MNTSNHYQKAALMPAWRRCDGFNLVEIALAVFVMSLGLVSLFALFPVGLGLADTARQETQIGMFADYVFGGLRVAAQSGAAWSEGTPPYLSAPGGAGHMVEHRPVDEITVEFPAHTDTDRHPSYLRYTLNLGLRGANPVVPTATLKVRAGRTGSLATTDFYTEFYPFKEVTP